MPEWLEGNQIATITATISDYMKDFEEFLVDFWSAKFTYIILEAVIFAYIRKIIFRQENFSITLMEIKNEPKMEENIQKQSFFSSFYQKTKEMTIKMVEKYITPSHCLVDDDSRGRLAQDVNTFNAFFSKKAGQEVATEFLEIINEISILLYLDSEGIAEHVINKIIELPSAALAIKEVALAAMRLRLHTDITKDDMNYVCQEIESVILDASSRQKGLEEAHIAEGRLGLLYSDLVPSELMQQLVNKDSLARNLKNMSYISFDSPANLKTFDNDDDDDDGNNDDNDNNDSDNDNKDDKGSTKKNQHQQKQQQQQSDLISDVLNVLSLQEEEENEQLLQLEEDRMREEAMRQRVGVLSYDGYMEKKSPAHNLWQVCYAMMMMMMIVMMMMIIIIIMMMMMMMMMIIMMLMMMIVMKMKVKVMIVIMMIGMMKMMMMMGIMKLLSPFPLYYLSISLYLSLFVFFFL